MSVAQAVKGLVLILESVKQLRELVDTQQDHILVLQKDLIRVEQRLTVYEERQVRAADLRDRVIRLEAMLEIALASTSARPTLPDDRKP